MGKQIVCDRCGSEIKEQPTFMNTHFPVIVVHAAVKESLLADFYEFDLFEKCKEYLVDWIWKGKEKDK